MGTGRGFNTSFRRPPRGNAVLRRTYLATAVMMAGSICLGAGSSGPPWYPDKYNLLVYIDEQGVQRPVRTAADWAIRRSHILSSVQLVTGPLPSRDQLPPLNVQITEVVDQGTYIQKKLTYVAEADGERVPAYLLIPKQLRTPNAAMLCLHQTAHGGKAEPVGLTLPPLGYPDLYYAKHLTERGYITLSPDYPGFGEYPLEPNARNVYERGYVSVTMKGVWNHMRAMDVLCSMPEVDTARVGVIGHSLGGHNAVMVALFDERIAVTVESCGVIPWEAYGPHGIIQFAHPYFYMPLIGCLFENDPPQMPFNWVEAMAAIAPRRLFFYEDGGTASIVHTAESLRTIYNFLGVPERLMESMEPYGHSFLPDVRAKAYRFVDHDLDEDGVVGTTDNCPTVANPDQADSDGDGVGNSCDNCPSLANAAQENSDGDGNGDACDSDDDNDGLTDAVDNCPRTANADQADSDGDHVGNACDNCRTAVNPGQEDLDADGTGDACDGCPANFYRTSPGPCGCDIICQESACADGMDNDGDALKDCADPDCAPNSQCPETLCTDGQDNDLDGATDCADPSCAGKSGCTRESLCSDGLDNDADGLTDGADRDCSGLITVYIEEGDPLRPPSDSERDGSIYGLNVQPEVTRSIYGKLPGIVAWSVAKFKPSNFLPAGTTSSDIASVVMRVPARDEFGYFEGDPFSGVGMVLHHFATTDSEKLVRADYHDPSSPYLGTPALHDYGVVIPRHQMAQDLNRYVLVDVTEAVRGDLDSGRPLSSFRVGADPASDLTGRHFASMPNSDLTAIDALICPGYQPAAGNVMKLIVRLRGRCETDCANGVDDDADGVTDCADADCYDDLACATLPFELCSDGKDNDRDGATDCQDSSCAAIAPCVEERCADGQDDDGDGLIDCGDPDCSDTPNCPETCNNQVDDDADGKIDCGDPECSSSELCPELCENGLDDNADGLVDCADAGCRCHPACNPVIQPEVCGNGIDDDCNGRTDGYDPACPFIISRTVFDGGNYNLDGNCGPATAPYFTFVIGTPGNIGSTPIWHVSKFTLDGFLPPGTGADDILAANLRIPDQDILRNGRPGQVPMHLHHFASTDGMVVTGSDGGYGTALSPALTDYGGILGGRDPLQADVNRFVVVDVTQAIRSDVSQGRLVAAFRIGHNPADAALTSGSNNYQIGDSNALAEGFGSAFAPPNGEGLVRLTIQLQAPVPPESCANGLDDDGDGAVDCADSDCTLHPACLGAIPDHDHDGDVDQADFGAIQRCLTGPFTWVNADCTHADYDENGHVDQADLVIFLNCMTGERIPAAPNCSGRAPGQ